MDLTRGALTVQGTVREPECEQPFEIGVSPRIGISKNVDWPLRFFIAGSRFVSRNATLKIMLKPTIFREYDIRGVAETELSSPDVVELGRGLGTLLQRKSGRSINLGRDCRLSSARLRDALLEGLIGFGLRGHRYRRGSHSAAVFFGGAHWTPTARS